MPTEKIRLSEEDLDALKLLLGAELLRATADVFWVGYTTEEVISTGVDGGLILTYSPAEMPTEHQEHLKVENSLRDVLGFWDVPKPVIQQAGTPDNTRRTSFLSFRYPSVITSIQVYQDVWEDDNGEKVFADVGVELKLEDDRSIVLGVNGSIICNVQLAFTRSGVQSILEGWTLRITLH